MTTPTTKPDYLPATFDRKAIMHAAHSFAKRHAFMDRTPDAYRFWFRNGLEKAWISAKAERVRLQQNVGLPVRSCFDDAPSRRRVHLRGNANIAHMIAS